MSDQNTQPYHLLETKTGNLYVWEMIDYQLLIKSGRNKKAIERASVKELFEHLNIDYALLGYTAEGAPYLKNHQHGHLSISHSNGWFAVYFDEHPVGVDVQVFSAPLVRGKSYFLHEIELKWAQDELFLQLIWCAKEALFKKYQGKIGDLKNEVITTEINLETKTISLKYHNKIEKLGFHDFFNGKLVFTLHTFHAA